MANKFLLPVYNKVFGEPFLYERFDNRIEMQNMVYLLQEKGTNIGHYGFDWYKHGLYSQALLDDMYMENKSDYKELNYTPEAKQCIERLHKIFNDADAKEKYGVKNWTECLASIHFLRMKELKSNASEEEVLQVLTDKKPHLNDDTLNRKAYCLIGDLDM